MLLIIELTFAAILLAILFVFFKYDGFSLKNRFRMAKVAEYYSGPERRQYPRFSKNLSVSYLVTKTCLSDADRFSGKTIDISEGGLKVMLDEKLSPGTTVYINVSIPGSGEASRIAGTVAWTEDASGVTDPSGKRLFYSGIQFSSKNEPSFNRVVSYIRTLASSLKI